MDCCPNALYEHLCFDLAAVDGYDPYNPKLTPETTPRQYASYAMQKSLLKKYRAGKSANADDAALDKFLAVNTKCGEWELDIRTETEEVLFGEFKRALDDFWHKDGFGLVHYADELLARGRGGPGSSLGARGKDFYTKYFSSPLTVTSKYLYDAYRQWCELNPLWKDAEETRARTFGNCSIVDGNRLSFVDKTVDISRVIFVEPSLNMFYQLGFEQVLLDRLKEVFNISLATQQSINRELAHKGSQDGSLATIDLSSASDSISLKMLKSVLPKSFYDWLVCLRSSTAETPRGPVELKMVSTMGNGYTFPLETILFTCVVSACMRVSGLELRRNRNQRRIPREVANFGVYGDDIICPTEIAGKVMRLLELLGFVANTDKSFVEGPFRESCGGDFFMGHHVRGVYIKSLDKPQERYTAINSLFEWSRLTGIGIPNTIGYLTRSVKKMLVPMHENPDAGIRVPLSFVKRKRYCKHTGAMLYRRYLPRKLVLKINEDEGYIRVPKGEKYRLFNPDGLIIGLLQGCVRDCEVNVRMNVTLYNTKDGLSSAWNFDPPKGSFTLPFQGTLRGAADRNFLDL